MTVATELIGFGAAAIGALAFLPQVVKTWRTRSSSDLSYGMIGALTTGASLWIVYGIRIHSAPIVIGNATTLSLALLLLVLKTQFDSRRRPPL